MTYTYDFTQSLFIWSYTTDSVIFEGPLVNEFKNFNLFIFCFYFLKKMFSIVICSVVSSYGYVAQLLLGCKNPMMQGSIINFEPNVLVTLSQRLRNLYTNDILTVCQINQTLES